jgi:hypothetical protein
MADPGIAKAPGDPRTRDDHIAAYLAELAPRLPGPRRRREDILAELRDGLDQAADDHITAGLPPEQAAIAAITQFGTPRVVAQSFAGELAIAYARRTIAWYLASGPLVGIWWLLLLHPSPWRTGLIALIGAIPVIPLIAIAATTGGATLASTGRLMCWLPETRPDRALAAVGVLATAALIGDLTMITTFAVAGVQIQPLSAAAILASLARTTCSLTTLRHATLIRSR